MAAARTMATLAVTSAVLAAGCAGSEDREEPKEPAVATTTEPVEAQPTIPEPPIGETLPPNYRAQKVLQASLSGGVVPETVVTAIGPPTGDLNFHPATLQVLSWDALAKRWSVIFDGQKVIARDGYGSPLSSNGGPGWRAGIPEEHNPILDPEADVTVDQVEFASLLPGDRNQLIFSATLSYGGSGVPSTLVVVDFEDAKANVLYTWMGEHLEWELDEARVSAQSSYWTIADAHCCPSRSYSFEVGYENGYITVLEDERPYLGILVRLTGGAGALASPLEVIEIAEDSPAAGVLRVGDVLLDVENAPPPQTSDPAVVESIFNKLSALDAGQTAQLFVARGGAEMSVKVKLGSLRDAGGGLFIPADDYTVDAL